MASSFLIDLSQIDLTQVALTYEQVGEINPQTGPMRQLDHVIWVADDLSATVGVKHVQDDEFWVEGHIPGRPLFPGVLMIEAAAQLSSVIHQLRPTSDQTKFHGFTRCDNVAFRGQVVPGDDFYLVAKEISFRPKRFVIDTQGIVNDRLVFEARVTGMVM